MRTALRLPISETRYPNVKVQDIRLWPISYRVQVSKWGNSLAVRLPVSVVEALDLHEGDETQIEIAGSRHFRVGRDVSRLKALERLKALNWPLPSGFTFSREEANER